MVTIILPQTSHHAPRSSPAGWQTDSHERSAVSVGSGVRLLRKKTHPIRDEEGRAGIARPEGSCDNTPEPTLLSAGVSAL